MCCGTCWAKAPSIPPSAGPQCLSRNPVPSMVQFPYLPVTATPITPPAYTPTSHVPCCPGTTLPKQALPSVPLTPSLRSNPLIGNSPWKHAHQWYPAEPPTPDFPQPFLSSPPLPRMLPRSIIRQCSNSMCCPSSVFLWSFATTGDPRAPEASGTEPFTRKNIDTPRQLPPQPLRYTAQRGWRGRHTIGSSGPPQHYPTACLQSPSRTG